MDHQFAIGNEFFKLPTDEKLKYRADLENGGYNGYKPLGIREILSGKFDVSILNQWKNLGPVLTEKVEH